MSFVVDASYGLDALIAVGAIFALIWVARGKVAKETRVLMAENKQALEDRIEILERDRDKNIKRISDLEGEVRVIKEIPLQKLADNYELISQHLSGILESQNKILATQNVLLTAVSSDTSPAGQAFSANPSVAA